MEKLPTTGFGGLVRILVPARLRFVLPTVGLAALVMGCDTAPRSDSGDSSPSILGLNSSQDSDSKRQDEGAKVDEAVPQVGDLKLSKVTALGLRKAGVRDIEGLVEWFNAIPGEGDPFLDPMAEEIRRASPGADSMADLKLSGVTVEALAAQGITTPADIARCDQKVLKDSRKPLDLCRNEICSVMQGIGWTVLRAEVTNRAKATQLLLNDTLIGPLASKEETTWRRFLVNAPGSPADLKVFATLTIDVPNPENGMPVGRWFKDVELERGGEVRISVDVTRAPLLSIGFAPGSPLSPGAVYAGDKVTLTCEGGGEDTVWFTFGAPGRLDAQTYNPSPRGNSITTGLPAWFRLRGMAEAAATDRDGYLDEPDMEPVYLGTGSTFAWTPEVETTSARIGVLSRGPGGFWGFAERTIAVADLRPGLWMMPNLPIDPESQGALEAASGAINPSPDNIYRTYDILGKLTYLAGVGSPISVDLRRDEYRDASLPLASVKIDFGDGSEPVTVPAAEADTAQVQHTYSKPGTYRVRVESADAMGFKRIHGTTIAASSEAPPPPPAPRVEVSDSPVKKRIEAVGAESSFDLFHRAADQFARLAVERSRKAWQGKSIAIAHIHDHKDQGLVDLMDSSLVSELLAEDATVIEREPMFQNVIDALGFVEASTVSLVEQGSHVPQPFLSTVTEGKIADPDLLKAFLAKTSTTRVPQSDLVLDYKLKRAEVKVSPSGVMVVRTARIFAWVRIHERESMRILFDGDVTVALGGTVAAAESVGGGNPWDSYPDGYLIRRVVEDKAIESVREVPSNPSTPVPALPAVPAVPQAPSGGIADSIKGLFGG